MIVRRNDTVISKERYLKARPRPGNFPETFSNPKKLNNLNGNKSLKIYNEDIYLNNNYIFLEQIILYVKGFNALLKKKKFLDNVIKSF